MKKTWRSLPPKQIMMSKLRHLLRSLLPGFFLVGFTIGTGSVTSMVKAGADHGTSLLWALLLSCVVSYILFDSFGRLTIYSGKTALNAIRSHIHPWIALFILAALTINVSASVMGVMGIMAGVLAEWTRSWNGFQISATVWAVILSSIIFVVLLKGSVKSLEVLLAALAGAMGVCFLLNAANVLPPLGKIVSGLVPNIPAASANSESSSGYLVVASMVGTTVAPIVLMLRSIVVREQGWTAADHHAQKRDAAISNVVVFIISASVMITAAGSLNKHGMDLSHVREMIPLLEPLIGSLAVFVFVVGVTAAGMSSQFPNIVSVPWLLHDYRGEAIETNGQRDTIIIFGLCAISLVVPIFQHAPIWVMLVSQALGAIILPMTIVCLAYLLNKKTVMGENVNSATQNTILFFVVVFAFAMAAVGTYGLAA